MDRVNGWTAVVLAGSRPGGDPLAEAFGTDLKALIPVGGTPMVQRPVEALLASQWIDRVVVVAQQPQRIASVLAENPRLSVETSGPTIAQTVGAIAEDPATRWPLLITTADHVLLTPEMIDDFCRHSSRCDISIGLVERSKLRQRLPASKRTWIKFRGGAFSGANLFQLRTRRSAEALGLWRSVEQERKKGWRMVWALGPAIFLGAVLRMLTIEQVMERIGNRLGLAIRVVRMRDPLAAVDVDKVSDHKLVEAILAGRA